MFRRICLLSALALWSLSSTAHSASLNYTFSGVWSDGGLLSGSFTIDDVTESLSAFVATTSGGSSGLAPASYDLAEDPLVFPDIYSGEVILSLLDTGGAVPTGSSLIFAFLSSDIGLPSLSVLSGATWVTTEFHTPPGSEEPGAGRDLLSGTAVLDAGVNPVPEPSTLLLLGTGLVGLAGYGHRRRKTA